MSDHASNLAADVQRRATELHRDELKRIWIHTDRMFAVLMVVQFLFAVAAALIITPRTWIGSQAQVHVHVWAAVVLGACIASLPIFLAWRRPGAPLTRHVIATAQMMFSALLIHVTGGRIETHFHIFGSLAFLAFYRDYRVLLTATVVTAIDHFVRGIWWPESVFGVLAASPFRWVEHAGWVLFEDFFLLVAGAKMRKVMSTNCSREARLEFAHRATQEEVAKKTTELELISGELKAHLEAIDRSELRIDFDSQGVILDANTLLLQSLGYELGELVGCSHTKLLPELFEIAVAPEQDNTDSDGNLTLDDSAPLENANPGHPALTEEEFWTALRSGTNQSGVFELRTSQGESVWIQATYNPVLNRAGQVEKIVAYGHDVTIQHRAQQDLQTSTAFLRAVLDGQTAHIVILDDEGNISNSNKAWDTFWVNNGGAPDNLPDQNYLELCEQADGSCSEEASKVASRIRRVLSGRSNFESYTYPCHGPEQRRWFTVAITPIQGTGAGAGVVVAHYNVTEQMEAAEALKVANDQNRLLATISERTSNAVLVTDSHFRVRWVNDGFERIFGISAEASLGRRLRSLEVFEPTERETLHRLLSACRQQKAFAGEVLTQTVNGEPRWVDLDVQPQWDEQGGLRGFMAVANDITDLVESRQQMESALREVEAMRCALDEHALISITDARGTIIDVNSGFCRLSGYERDELVGQAHSMLASGKHKKPFWSELWQTISSGRAWRGEICNRAKDGTLFWVDSTIVPYADSAGRIEKYVAIRFDITEQKRAQRNFEVLQSALEHNSIITVTDAEGYITDVNQGMCTASGYAREEILGQHISILNSELHDAGFRLGIQQIVAAGQVWRGELCDKAKDGQLYWCDCSVVPILDSLGDVESFVYIRFEITQNKINQQALAEAQSLLEQTGDLARVGGWKVDLELMKPIWSSEVYRIHGVQEEDEPALEEAIEFYVGDAQQTIRDALDNAIERGIPWDLELPFRDAKGNDLWVRTIGIAEHENGKCKLLSGAIQDITDQRLSKASLEALTRRLETATDGAGVGIWEYRLNPEELRWDRTTHRIYQTNASVHSNMFEFWMGVLPPSERIRALELLEQAVQTQQGFHTHFKIQATDRSIQHVHVSATVERDSCGEIYLVGTTQDVTAKYQAEERLELSMKAASIGLWDWDIKSGKTTYSDTFYTMLGYEPDELSGLDDCWVELVHQDDIESSREDLKLHLRGDTSVCRNEQRLRCKDGSWRWVQSVGEVIEWDRDGRPVRAVGVHIDIQPLKEMASRLELALSSANAGLWDWDILNECFQTNEQYYTMLGENPVQGNRPFDEFARRVHPNDIDALMEKVAKSHEDDQNRLDVEFRFRCKDGSYKWVHSTGQVIERSRDGAPIRMIGQQTDVDAHRRAQEDIEKLNVELAEQIKVAKQLAESAKAANQAKSQFLANMSHEIRTPMTAILGFSETLAENVQDSEQCSAIQTIRRNGEHLLTLINDILDLSKIEAGRFQIEELECSPQEILSELRDLMQVRADAKGLDWQVKIDGSIPNRVVTDPTRLRQILINLVGNAVKFTEVGSVQLIARAADDAGDLRLEFDIVDTGLGMGPDQLKNLFQPFMQADNSMSRRFGGSGLGLTISKRFAELLGGDITVSSAAGEGSSFSLVIKVKALESAASSGELSPHQKVAEKTEAPASKKLPLEGVRSLLVEDGPDNQRLIAFVLRKAGAEVSVADNGLIGMEKALEREEAGEPFDVILMDMQMPVMDGYTAARELRSRDFRRPIIALTAHAMTESRQECIDAGCNDYATKPIDRKDLIRIVQHYAELDSSQSSSEAASKANAPS